jgi:hypothetical protein
MLPVQWRRFNFFEKDLVRQGDLPHPEIKVLPPRAPRVIDC